MNPSPQSPNDAEIRGTVVAEIYFGLRQLIVTSSPGTSDHAPRVLLYMRRPRRTGDETSTCFVGALGQAALGSLSTALHRAALQLGIDLATDKSEVQ